MGMRWRVCIYHSAPSLTVCPVISSKHKPWAQSWISSIGSGLGLPRLYSTGFRRPVFASPSTKSSTPMMPNFSADTCTVRSKRTPLRGQIVLRPRLLVVNQRALARTEGVVLKCRKGNSLHSVCLSLFNF